MLVNLAMVKDPQAYHTRSSKNRTPHVECGDGGSNPFLVIFKSMVKNTVTSLSKRPLYLPVP